MESVEFVTDIRLPSLVRTQLRDQAERFVQRLRSRFGMVRVHLHVKHEGRQVACNLNLLTDDGRYVAHATGWDVRTVLIDALSNLDTQVSKQLAKRSAHTAASYIL